MATREFERETDDWAEIPLVQGSGTYTGDWSYQIQPFGDEYRPTGAWTAAVPVDSKKGIDIQGMTPGYYSVWIRMDGQVGRTPIFRLADTIRIR